MNRNDGQIIVSIRHASFCYENRSVFSEINFDIHAGEIFFLMGRNGCGKTTLIDSILGIHKLKKGQITVKDKSVYDYAPSDLGKEMAYVPQAHNRFFSYKVWEIVLMGRTPYISGFGSPEETDRQVVDNILKEVGISHLADRPYTQISGGEMQMVMLARALAQQTPFIIMDEPTVYLDFYNELLFLELVAGLAEYGKHTILLAAHDPNQVFYLASRGIRVRVGLMRDGGMYRIGTPEAVLTEETIADVYGIQSRIVRGGPYQQIVPLHTNHVG